MPEPAVLLTDGRRLTATPELTIGAGVRADDGDTLHTVTVVNHGDAALALAEIVVLCWEPGTDERDLSDAALWLHGRQMNTGVFTHHFGRSPERGGFAGQHRTETADGVCYTAASGVALLATRRGCRLWGFVGGARQFGEVRIMVDRAERMLLRVECVCLLDGWTLAPGERLASEALIMLDGDDPAALLERYADATARVMQARPPRPTPTGWCSWYSLYNQTSAEAALANVAALRDARLPVALVQIDDGYQTATGDWLTANERFPDGMAALATRIREAGFAPGLWLAPFVLHRESATLRDHPDWAVRERDGTVRLIGSWLGEVAALDCTQPEARAWLARVVQTAVRDWGYGYLKLDALAYATQPNALYHAPNTTAAANLRAGLEVIRAAAGEQTYILGCTCDFAPAIGLVDAMRVGADVETRWYDPPRLPSAFNALRLTLPRWFMHGRWWNNDPDCLLAREANSALSLEETRTLATGIAIAGGSVFLGDDVRTLSTERLALARALLPPAGLALRPRDLLARETPRIFAAERTDGGASVALFNWDDAPATIGATAAQLALPSARYHVFEFWERLYLGLRTELPRETIAPHGCRLYRLTPDRGRPCLIGAGTTIALERIIAAENWQADERRLTIDLATRDERPESLYVAVPPELRDAGLQVSGALALERLGTLLRLDANSAASSRISLHFSREQRDS